MSNPNYPSGPYPPDPNQRHGGYGPPPGRYSQQGPYPPQGPYPSQGQYPPSGYYPPQGQYQPYQNPQQGQYQYPPASGFAAVPPARRGGTVAAFLAAGLLVFCAILSALVAHAARDEEPTDLDEAVRRAKMATAVFGAAFLPDDAENSAETMWINITWALAAVAVVLALLLAVSRSSGVRFFAGILGLAVGGYYIYAAIDLKNYLEELEGFGVDTEGFYTWIIAGIVLWLAVAVLAFAAVLGGGSRPAAPAGHSQPPNYYGR